MNRFSDRRISQKKLFGFRIWRIFYTDLRILLIQRIADLSNILSRIVDLACNLVRILDCDFILELLADSNLDKSIVGSRILLQIWADRRICIPWPIHPPPPPHYICIEFPNLLMYQMYPDVPVLRTEPQIFYLYRKFLLQPRPLCPLFHNEYTNRSW